AFHREIANQSNNTILQQHLAAIEVKIHIARFSDRFNDPIRKNKATLKEHALILQAITDRDKTAAVITVRNNITHMKQHFERDVAPLMTEVMGINHTN
ncbi:MAG: FCD domain-containing protein, partial [Eubacteriales bacterium]|nr:FCD domain-containing protein [Eubacteriales bacterium]